MGLKIYRFSFLAFPVVCQTKNAVLNRKRRSHYILSDKKVFVTMSYPDDDRWAFDDDERCVPSKNGYFLNEKECGDYKALRDEHLKSLTDEQLRSKEWHYGPTPNQRTRWCAPREGGEHDSFAKCEKSRLLNNLNIFLAQSGGGGRSLLGKTSSRSDQTRKETLRRIR